MRKRSGAIHTDCEENYLLVWIQK